MSRFPFPLRFSIPVILFLFAVVFSTVFFQRETFFARKRVEADMTQQAIFSGNQTVGLLEYFYHNQNERGVDLLIDQLGGAPNVNMALILDEQNRVLWSTQRNLKDIPLEKTPISSFQENLNAVRQQVGAQAQSLEALDTLWVFHPVGLELKVGRTFPDRVGVLAIEYDLSIARRTAYQDAAMRSLAYGMAIAILGTLLWFFFDRTVTKRASHLVETSKYLARGSLAVRATLKGSDEMYRIAVAFNQMAEEIQKNHEALEQTLRELKQTQSQLIQAEKMSGLGQMVAGVAHEINNPINFIYGNVPHVNRYTQDLLEIINEYQRFCSNPIPEIEDKLEEMDFEFILSDLPKLLNSIRSGASRVKEIVVGLRTFSRLDESQNKIVDIHQNLDSTILILQHRLQSNKNIPEIKIIKSYHDLPEIECYAGQLNQVFFNILNNSIDALVEIARDNQESQEPIISIQTKLLDNNQIEIEIADNGQGIDPKIKNNIFDPFFTTKPIGSGTGLGLSVAYQIIVEKHKGTLICHSKPGVGTKFVMTIPKRLSSFQQQAEMAHNT